MAKRFGNNCRQLTGLMRHLFKKSNVSSTRQFIECLLFILITVGGCATSSIREQPEKYNEIASAQSIVVVPIGNRAADIAECVHEAIQRVCQNLQFFPPERFVDSMFPWFEPGTFPKTKEDLDALRNSDLVRAKIQTLGIRYVIAVSGETVQDSFHGIEPDVLQELLVRFGFVYIEADRKTDIYASMIDLKETVIPMEAESHRDKTHKYAWWLVFPLYIKPAITETPACAETGEKIARQISGCNSTADKEVKE
jgi:hypothetical protein